MQRQLSMARRCFESGELELAERLYRQVVQAEGASKEAIHGLGATILRRGDAKTAVVYLERALAVDKSDAGVQNHLGVAFAELELPERAAGYLSRAVRLNPRLPDAQYNLAKVLDSLQKWEDAVMHYRASLAIKPAPEVHYNLGNTLRQLGRLEEAAAEYREALRSRPKYVKALTNLGNTLRELGRLEEAATMHREAIELKGDYAEGYHNLGLVLGAQGKQDEAADCHRRALEIKPDFTVARNSLSRILTEQGKCDEAMELLREVTDQDQETLNSWLEVGGKLREEGRLEDAITCIEDVLKVKADLAAAHHSLGLVMLAKGEAAEAEKSFRKAIEIQPGFAEAHSNLGISLQGQKRFAEALEHTEIALRINPKFAPGHLNRAVIWLGTGEFQKGWHEFEWRRLCKDHRIRRFPGPLWDGRRMPDATILLHAEQGLGDTIQFIRYAPLVKERCGKVAVQCQGPLKALLGRCRGIDQLTAVGEPLPAHDVQAPFASLPAIMGTTLWSVPREAPYIWADERLLATWREQLSWDRSFKVGIAWQGSPAYPGDRFRSVAVEHFARLALPGVKLFSLQKGPGADQLAKRSSEFEVHEFGPEFDTTAGPFMDTAAVMMNLDLVISSDTAIVHLAGALGVPVWVLLGYSADWRWLDGRGDSPWYPTMRLFRQRRFGDWDELFRRVAAELREVVGGIREKLPPAAPSPRPIHMPISPGELLDRITILETKSERIPRQEKLANVRKELEQLKAVRGRCIVSSAELKRLVQELKAINERLWEAEDHVRDCESRDDFGPGFIEHARAIYSTNDRRAAVKREINRLLGSELLEEKFYEAGERS